MRSLGFESSIWNYRADADGPVGSSVRRYLEHSVTGGAVDTGCEPRRSERSAN